MREIIHLACEECSRRNYHTTKNKKTHAAKFTGYNRQIIYKDKADNASENYRKNFWNQE